MIKCTFCDKTVKNPRGNQAMQDGWSVLEVTVGKDKVIIIDCGDKAHEGMMMAELDKNINGWKHRRDKK